MPWRTINGTPVLIGEDGEITKGPDALVGKKPSELGDDKKPVRVKETGGEDNPPSTKTKPEAIPAREGAITKDAPRGGIDEIRKWRGDLSADENAAVGKYAAYEQTGYKQIRDSMLGKDTSPESAKLAKDFGAAIDKAPTFQGEVFRGARLDEATARQMIAADSIELKSFASSSANPAVASKFAVSGQGRGTSESMPVVMRVKTNTGALMTPVGRLGAQGEQEIVLKPGSRYRVVKGEITEPKPGFKQALLHLEEIAPKQARPGKVLKLSAELDDMDVALLLADESELPERFSDNGELWAVSEDEGDVEPGEIARLFAQEKTGHVKTVMQDGNYKWVENEDGSITVLDVEVMGVLGAGERKDSAEVVTREDLPLFLAKTLEIESKLKREQLYLLTHNDYKNGKAAPVIGKVRDRYVDGDWIKGKLHVTRPEQIAQVKRGELPNRSPEFIKRGPNRGYMWALAATEGLPGHFDDRLPALILEKMPLTEMPELATLCAQDELAICTLSAPPLTLSPVPTSSPHQNELSTETYMPLSKEDLDAIASKFSETIDAKLKPIKDQVATLSAQPKVDDDPEGAISAQASKLVQDQIAGLEKQKKDNELELARSQAMATLSVETSLTKPAIRKLLEGVPVDAIKYKVESLKAKYGKADVKLGDEDTVAAFGEAAALSKEYEAAGGEKELGVTESQYVAMFQGKITEGLAD